MISDDGLTAEITKPNGRKSRYEIIQTAPDSFKAYVSRRRNNSRWSQKFLLSTSKVPIKIVENHTLQMKIEFQPY